jgi:aconitate hydratase
LDSSVTLCKVAGILTVKVEQELSLNILEKAQLLCLVLEKEQSIWVREIGATTSTFGYDDSMSRYLRSTNRAGYLMLRISTPLLNR